MSMHENDVGKIVWSHVSHFSKEQKRAPKIEMPAGRYISIEILKIKILLSLNTYVHYCLNILNTHFYENN